MANLARSAALRVDGIASVRSFHPLATSTFTGSFSSSLSIDDILSSALCYQKVIRKRSTMFWAVKVNLARS